MRKTLALRRETLTELTGDELAGVNGASTVITPALITVVTTKVISFAGTCA